MNKLTKHFRAILAMAIMLCVELPTLAHDFEVGGIYYNYLDKSAKTVAVTYKGSYYDSYSDEYTGSVTIPSSVTYSGTTYSVTEIGYGAFSGCSGLTSITIPNSVTSIGNDAFYGTGWYNNQPNGILYLDNCCLGYKGDNPTGSLSLKEGTRLIGAYAFENCTGLTSITIPNSVTTIGAYAFEYCSGLTSITISNSVTEIGEYAFYNCTDLTEVTIPNSVTTIGNSAFYDCTGLISVTIPNSVTSIGDGAFWECSGLTSIVVEEGSPKYDSRDNCNAIVETSTNTLILGCKNSTIPNSVTSIGYYAFSGCTGLKSVAIGNSVTSISDYAFYKCSGLTSITIPNSVTTIGAYAFEDCSGLTSITISNSVTEIGEYAFYDCTGLTEVNISDLSAWCKIDFSDYAANPLLYANKLKLNGTEIKDLVISNDITEIKDYAFYRCSGLISVIIPNSVTSIGEYAFDCNNLRIVKSLSNTPQQCDDYAFGKNPAALLMVPKGSMMSYMLADGWRHFTKIQEFEVEDAVKPVLTIAYPEGGVIKQKVDNGTILELQIVPSNGWKCNSVTFNGVDVTNNLDADGNYNTPSITADSQLSIVFVKDDGGVESTLANDIKVCVNGNTVTILGADEFDDVEIYNTSGINVYNGIEKSITLDSNGIYILTVEGETFKFAM